jgi:hypothetical protein
MRCWSLCLWGERAIFWSKFGLVCAQLKKNLKKEKFSFFYWLFAKSQKRSPKSKYARRYSADALYVQRRWVCSLPAHRHPQA